MNERVSRERRLILLGLDFQCNQTAGLPVQSNLVRCLVWLQQENHLVACLGIFGTISISS